MSAITAAAAAAPTDSTTNFTDILKNSVTENFVSDISISKIIITMAISFIIGFFIYLLYKRVFSGVLYSKSFNVSLIGMTMVTSMVIIAINSNLVLSLGMVGALSIVRFRTPIKDPTDLIFLFWAAAAGIVSGAGFFTLAAIGSIIVGLVMFFFIKSSSVETPYLLVVNCDGDTSELAVHKQLNTSVKRFNVKQKTVTNGNIEMTLEIRLHDKEGSFVNQLSGISGVKNAVLISYSGDYVS
ncbi:DUF4956 domain-containing protein [Paenibacillus antarcticus]|uniref:DUF4956 domain-containing protein n=1 Tax=Paenibacillus antarcticus TaxID=253703 RepID=A0A168LTD6_9BACL|nr:DUF4956 domain-containing protein [Paenibacillus antarcticus]OAB43811.1 hypothetical protein PBAT_16405 [Paenibacillus antarcticus]